MQTFENRHHNRAALLMLLSALAGISVRILQSGVAKNLVSARQSLLYPVTATTIVLSVFIIFCFTRLLMALWHIPFVNTVYRLRYVFLSLAIPVLSLWKQPFLRPVNPVIFEASLMIAFFLVASLLFRYPVSDNLRHSIRHFAEHNRYRILAILILIIGSAWFAGAFGPRRHPVGDEPSYLMITHSIANDFDVVLDNDYAERHYERFFYGAYPMFTHLGYDGRNYPHHSIGLPVILAPVYALAWHGSEAFLVFSMRFTLLVIYMLLAIAVLRLIESFGISRGIAFWSATAGMLSGPMFFYTGEIYPETTAALVFVLLVTFLAHSSDKRTPLKWLTAGFGLGIIPWLGIKYIPTAVVILVIAIVCLVKETHHFKKSTALMFFPVVSALLYLGFLYSIYRNINPSVIYTGVYPGTSQQVLPPDMPGFLETLPDRLSNMVIFTWGFFLEQRIGLLFLMPAAMFIVPGLRSMYRRQRRPSLVLLGVTLTHFGFYAWHNNWGGYCPPNRQAISIIPLLLVPLAYGFSAASTKWPGVIACLTTFAGWRFTLGLLNNERWLYMTMNPHLTGGGAHWLYRWSPLDTNALIYMFPLLMGPEKRWIPNMVWTTLFMVLIWVIFPSRRQNISPVTSRHIYNSGLVLYCSVLVLGLAIAAFIPPHTFHKLDLTHPVDSIYFADGSFEGNSGPGFWLKGDSDGRMLLSSQSRLSDLNIRIHSLTANTIIIKTGRYHEQVEVFPNQPVYKRIRVGPWRSWSGSYIAKLAVNVDCGIHPFELDDTSTDHRYLGVYLTLLPD
jgi:hypothetical protein